MITVLKTDLWEVVVIDRTSIRRPDRIYVLIPSLLLSTERGRHLWKCQEDYHLSWAGSLPEVPFPFLTSGEMTDESFEANASWSLKIYLEPLLSHPNWKILGSRPDLLLDGVVREPAFKGHVGTLHMSAGLFLHILGTDGLRSLIALERL
jgi:hypothetical protein